MLIMWWHYLWFKPPLFQLKTLLKRENCESTASWIQAFDHEVSWDKIFCYLFSPHVLPSVTTKGQCGLDLELLEAITAAAISVALAAVSAGTWPWAANSWVFLTFWSSSLFFSASRSTTALDKRTSGCGICKQDYGGLVAALFLKVGRK